MGKGIELAKKDAEARMEAPIHAEVIEEFRDQLLVALIRRMAKDSKDGTVRVPVTEVDNVGGIALLFHVEQGQEPAFIFRIDAYVPVPGPGTNQ